MIQQTIFDIIACFFVLFGLFFMFVGALGIIRFPDAYNRLHAASKCSTLGLAGLTLAAVFHIATMSVVAKGLMLILFAFVATPVGSHILAKAAHIDRMKQWPKTLSDELAEDKPDRRPRNAEELAAILDGQGVPPTGYVPATPSLPPAETSRTPDRSEEQADYPPLRSNAPHARIEQPRIMVG